MRSKKPKSNSLVEHTKDIQAVLGHRPLYTAALYPDDATGDIAHYNPWFIAHLDEDQLQPKVIHEHWERFIEQNDVDPVECMEEFVGHLESLGYVSLHTAQLWNDEYNCQQGYLTIDRDSYF